MVYGWSSSPLHQPTSSISPEDLYSNDFDCCRGWLTGMVEHTYSIDCCCCSWWLSVGKFGPLEALGKLWIDQRTTKLINAPVDYTLLVSSAASLGWVGWAELSAQSKTPLFLINLHYILHWKSFLNTYVLCKDKAVMQRWSPLKRVVYRLMSSLRTLPTYQNRNITLFLFYS